MDILIFILAVGLSLLTVMWKRFSLNRLLIRRAVPVDSPDDSAIIAYYTAGHMVAGANRSKLNGMKYSTYLTLPAADAVYDDGTAAIVALDLPFNTEVHLLGLTKEHGIDRVQFEAFLGANGMEKVELEGDFPDYFDIYAAPGQEAAVRLVLNPESMAYVVDYCRTHFWEINCSELYIVASENDRKGDNFIADSQCFIEQIKPALLPGQVGAASVHHAVPYGEYDGPPLPCPLCQKIMVQTDNWFACPDGHGVLIDGADIIRLRDHTLDINLTAAKTAEHGIIPCPNCHNQMTLVNYQDSGVEIDSCEHCPYRWLDAPEVTALGSKV